MKIFVLLSRIPWPLEKGDKLRAWHQLQILSKRHEIFLCCLNDQKIHPDAEKQLKLICSQYEIINLNRFLIGWRLFLALFSDRPFQVHYFYQFQAAKKIRKAIAQFKPDHIYCQLIRTTEYVKNHIEIKKTLDYMDALNAGHSRRIGHSPWVMGLLLREEAKRLVAYENLIFDYFDHHTIISIPDQKLLLHPHRDRVMIIPNGVDSDYFQPTRREIKFDLVFTGNMSYPPNIACARYLVNEILTLISRIYGDVTLLIAGANPSSSIRKLASEHVQVSGWVEDIRESYASSRIFVAPMQIGTGLQNKLLEAMSMGLPCVTSSLVSAALGTTNGKHLLVADTAEMVSRHIVSLLEDEQLRINLSASGRQFVLDNFQWEKTVDRLDNLISGKSG